MSGRGKSKRDGPLPRDVQVSKRLSKLLRHDAEREGLVISKDGYINVASVLANQKVKSAKITFAEIKEVVRDNEKQRFNLIPDPDKFPEGLESVASDDPKDWLIRANQGHSIKLEPGDGLLTSISKENAPREAVHGTTHANWVLIAQSGGLKPMGRTHVHFATGLPEGVKSLLDIGRDAEKTSEPVVSGMRSKSQILIYLNIPKALESGLPLHISQNSVILSEGNAEGLVPLSLLSRVEDRTGQGILLQDGQIIKEAPTSWAKKSKPTR